MKSDPGLVVKAILWPLTLLTLLQRLIEPEEIAHMCVYLASPLASA